MAVSVCAAVSIRAFRMAGAMSGRESFRAARGPLCFSKCSPRLALRLSLEWQIAIFILT